MADLNLSLTEMAAQVTELAEAFTQQLKDNGVQMPTLSPDGPISYDGLTGEMFLKRQKLIDALNDMLYLTSGPSESVFNYAHSVMPDVADLSLLNHFDFWSAVPLDGAATYDDIAKHTTLPLAVVTRALDHATTLRFFVKDHAVSPPTIRHTSRSAALAKSEGLRALVSTVLDDAGPPMTVLNQTLRKFAAGREEITRSMDETAFAYLHSGGEMGKYKNSWDYIENDGECERKGWRQRTFTKFMAYIKEIFRLEDLLINAYDWEAAGNAKVVDLGGSGGHDTLVLAKKFPNLHITVQDLPEAEATFKSTVPSDLNSRVSFMAHDFFTPQPLDANIFIIKLILHDWPDEESVKILRALVPAMRPGSKVLLIEYVGKQSNPDDLPRSIQNMGTATDLRMMALFNCEERPVEAWKGIFAKADERFELVRTEADPLSFFVVIEAVWKE